LSSCTAMGLISLLFFGSVSLAEEPSPVKTVLLATATDAIVANQGRRITVEGRLVEASQGKNGIIYFNFTEGREGLVAICPTRFVGAFEDTNLTANYKGKEVRITGFVEIYKGRPQIVLYKPTDIVVIKRLEPAEAASE